MLTTPTNIIVYTRPNCSFCTKAKALLAKHNFGYDEKIIGKDITRDDVVAQFPTMRTVPIILIDRKLIGGFDQLVKWFEDNDGTPQAG